LTFTVPPSLAECRGGQTRSFQQKTDGMSAGGDLDASGRELAGGNAVHKNFRAAGVVSICAQAT